MALFTVDVFHHLPIPPALPASITERLDQIMASYAELAAGMNELKEINERDRVEVAAKLAALQAAIEAASAVDPAVLAAYEDLRASIVARDADVGSTPA